MPTNVINTRSLAASLLLVSLALVGCVMAEEATGEPGLLQLGPNHRASAALADPRRPLDTEDPQIAHLAPDLLAAVQAAARDARRDGLLMVVNSGWRSREHQQRLYDDAVAEYGSEEEARRYVATPDVSAHTTGNAVDIGPTDADFWLIEHGADYGLCQIFANEIWHFELAMAPGGTCPDLLPDGSARGYAWC